MKKRGSFLVLFLCLTLLWTMLPGCQSTEEQPKLAAEANKKPDRPELTICLDLRLGSDYTANGDLSNFLTGVPGYIDEFKVNIEEVPGKGADREAAMTRIRTEMVSGSGPDLFICACPSGGNQWFPQKEEGLFNYPKALMERNMFLPLDSYIENAEFMEWDRMYPQIMEAGRDSQGRQQLIPLGWTSIITLIDKEQYTPTAEMPMTWDEMLESDDPGVRFAVWSNYFGASLGVLADYERDEPSFTQEELAAHLEGARLNLETRDAGGGFGVTEDGYYYAKSGIQTGRPNVWFVSAAEPDQYYIPQYNRDGGSTAYITAFAAININARQPELAFRVLDKLLSLDIQQNADLYSWVSGMPVYKELCREDYSVNESFESNGNSNGGKTWKKWRMSDWNHDQLDSVIEQLTAVDFYTPMNRELTKLYEEYTEEESPEKRESLIAEHYTTMRMMLAES